MTLPQNDVTAVVLSGGGAHGAYEAGVLKALMTGAVWTTGNKPFAPDVITGTSIGAYNAAVLASHLEVEGAPATARYLENLWLNVMPRDANTGHNHVYRFRANPAELLATAARSPLQATAELGADTGFFARDWLRRGINFFTSSSGTLGQRSLELVDLSTLMSREPSERLLRQTVVLDNIRCSPRLLFLVATNWRTGEVKFFQKEDMTDDLGFQIIMASSALPGIFPAVDIAGETYVDGGLVLNTPLLPAFVLAQPGADTAHVIYLDPQAQDIPLQPLHSTIDTMDRLITIGLAKGVDADMRIAWRVNRGLELLESAGKGERPDHGTVSQFIQSASFFVNGIGGRIPDSPKTIHRYRPSRYLGGTLSLLNFNRGQMSRLMELGFNDAVAHDCTVSKCVLPTGGVPLN